MPSRASGAAEPALPVAVGAVRILIHAKSPREKTIQLSSMEGCGRDGRRPDSYDTTLEVLIAAPR
jgi:hypothetical protein